MTMNVPVSRGLVMLVDDEDFERVSAKAWIAVVRPNYRTAIHHWRVRGQAFHAVIGRFILNPPDHLLVDHISGDALDNRRANLRICTSQQNAFNRGARAGKTFKGIYSDARSHGVVWRARIWDGGRNVNLGSYPTAEAAAFAYDRAALRLHGEFARLNLPELAEAQA